MDHFIGFDYLLRVCLGRDCHISIFGPPGFHRQIENKINAYTWNLVENYTNDFALHVTEVHPEHKLHRSYHCRRAFEPEIEEADEHFPEHSSRTALSPSKGNSSITRSPASHTALKKRAASI